MKTKLQKCLTEKIGFVSKEQLIQYEVLNKQSDIIAKYSRLLDISLGGLCFSYMALLEINGSNDLLSEAYKSSVFSCRQFIQEMIKELEQVETEYKE